MSCAAPARPWAVLARRHRRRRSLGRLSILAPGGDAAFAHHLPGCTPFELAAADFFPRDVLLLSLRAPPFRFPGGDARPWRFSTSGWPTAVEHAIALCFALYPLLIRRASAPTANARPPFILTHQWPYTWRGCCHDPPCSSHRRVETGRGAERSLRRSSIATVRDRWRTICIQPDARRPSPRAPSSWSKGCALRCFLYRRPAQTSRYMGDGTGGGLFHKGASAIRARARYNGAGGFV
ncbi:hypothetical protein C8R47DRAFT_111483 [Mycena vitilis]|nr:hypothetical protein C8R47DRAFT_111483 [Mycena vitilis]